MQHCRANDDNAAFWESAKAYLEALAFLRYVLWLLTLAMDGHQSLNEDQIALLEWITAGLQIKRA